MAFVLPEGSNGARLIAESLLRKSWPPCQQSTQYFPLDVAFLRLESRFFSSVVADNAAIG